MEIKEEEPEIDVQIPKKLINLRKILYLVQMANKHTELSG